MIINIEKKKLKILLAIPYMCIAGAEHVVYSLALELKKKGHSVQIASSMIDSYLYDRISKEGIVFNIIKELKTRNVIGIIKGAFKLSKLIKRERFDIINSHSYIVSWIVFMGIKM